MVVYIGGEDLVAPYGMTTIPQATIYTTIYHSSNYMISKYKAVIFDFQGVLDVNFDVTRRVLGELKQSGIQIGIGSNLRHQTLVQYLQQEKFGQLIDVVVGIDDVDYVGKPAPEIFLLNATLLQVGKMECLVMGDSTSDEEAAGHAGMDFIGIFGARFQKETQTVRTLEEIHNYL